MFHPLNFFGDHGGSSEVYYGCKSSPFPKKLRSSSWLSMSLTHGTLKLQWLRFTEGKKSENMDGNSEYEEREYTFSISHNCLSD